MPEVLVDRLVLASTRYAAAALTTHVWTDEQKSSLERKRRASLQTRTSQIGDFAPRDAKNATLSTATLDIELKSAKSETAPVSFEAQALALTQAVSTLRLDFADVYVSLLRGFRAFLRVPKPDSAASGGSPVPGSNSSLIQDSCSPNDDDGVFELREVTPSKPQTRERNRTDSVQYLKSQLEEVTFDTEGFLASHLRDYVPWLTTFIASQMFARFTEARADKKFTRDWFELRVEAVLLQAEITMKSDATEKVLGTCDLRSQWMGFISYTYDLSGPTLTLRPSKAGLMSSAKKLVVDAQLNVTLCEDSKAVSTMDKLFTAPSQWGLTLAGPGTDGGVTLFFARSEDRRHLFQCILARRNDPQVQAGRMGSLLATLSSEEQQRARLNIDAKKFASRNRADSRTQMAEILSGAMSNLNEKMSFSQDKQVNKKIRRKSVINPTKEELQNLKISALSYNFEC
jgi:hypothetical protein